MKVKDLKKNNQKTIRINSDVLEIIQDRGYTLQSWIDEQLDRFITIDISDCQLVDKEEL